MAPGDRSVSGASPPAARVFFSRVPGREKARVRWQGVSPKRGRYGFRTLDVVTRSPFGLLERRVAIADAGRADRLPGRGPAHPALASGPAAGVGDPPGAPARPLDAAARVPRPARLPARRQPALDPLADDGAARGADGQGVRAVERARPGRPARPVAAPVEGHGRPARGPGAGRPVRRHRLPGDLPPVGPPPLTGLDRPHPRPAARAGLGKAAARAARTTGRRPRPTSEGSLSALLRRLAAVDPPRGQSRRRLDPPPQPDRGGRAVDPALGDLVARGLLGRVMFLDASRGDLAGYIKYGESLDARPPSTAATRPRSTRPESPIDAERPAIGDHGTTGRNGQGGRP